MFCFTVSVPLGGFTFTGSPGDTAGSDVKCLQDNRKSLFTFVAKAVIPIGRFSLSLVAGTILDFLTFSLAVAIVARIKGRVTPPCREHR